ncbi:MAG: FAD-dependent oxidoreductase [Trueperaceae bacterium]
MTEEVNVPVWHEDGWSGLAPLRGAVSADVCVVGLGGSGLSAVHELLALGVSVVGVDAGQVAGGAAGRNGGLMLAGVAAFHHDAVTELGSERATALYRLTEQARERELAARELGVKRTGSLRIATDDAELADCEVQYRQMTADGLAVERYSGPEGQGLLFPLDATFNPLKRCRVLATTAVAAGARLFEYSPVTALEPGRVVTAGGAVSCAAVIVAVDGRLELLLPELADSVRTARLQMLATEPTGELTLPLPVYRRYGYEYYQRTSGGRIALGGFRDRAGESEWTTEALPEVAVQFRLERFLREVLQVRARITHRWAASVGYTRGVLPVVRRVREGLFAVGGYNGTGNLVGAVAGRAAAHTAVGRESEAWALLGGN